MESLVSLFQASCESVCLDLRIQARWLLRGLKMHHRIVVVIYLECSHPRRCGYYVIVSEFGKRYEFNPIVLLIVEESPEILLHPLVLLLCLSVDVWMEGCREPMVSTQLRTYPGPESACKLGAAISNYVTRNATLGDDVFQEKPGQFRQVDILPPW